MDHLQEALNRRAMGYPYDEDAVEHAVADGIGGAAEADIDTDETWVVSQSIDFVTEEELELLITSGAKKDIEQGEISFPPEIESALRLATEFYDTYLADISDLDRVEVIDRYVAKLIELLEAVSQSTDSEPEEADKAEPVDVATYVRKVHALALAT